MSSTKEERRMRRLWEGGIAPAAKRLQERGVSFFPMGPTDDDSWYVPGPEGSQFFEREPEHLGRDLEALWREQGLPELAELAQQFADLANEFEIHQQEPDEISPFVYVMY